MRTVDLFCGCGGMSLGFQNAGFEVVAAYDNWEPAVSVYKENFTHPVFRSDLSADTIVSEIREFSPALIIGGPPCQDFSIAGKKILGSRANLTIRFSEIVAELLPYAFVMENVHNIERAGALALVSVRRVLTAAGYTLLEKVLDASYYGVPQTRKRFFMIGCLDSKIVSVKSALEAAASYKPLTVRDYFGSSLGTDFYYRHPRTYGRRAVFSIDEPSPTVRGVNRPIPSTYKKHDGDRADPHSGAVRVLTMKERSYIQTFPESFAFMESKEKGISKSSLEQMIGNAVPVKLAEAVARELHKIVV